MQRDALCFVDPILDCRLTHPWTEGGPAPSAHGKDQSHESPTPAKRALVYRYVSVEGPIVAVDPADVERDLRPLARRYLGAHEGDAYIESTREEHSDNVLVRMRPERWLAVDFSKTVGTS